MRIAVLGASGRIGSAIVQKLCSRYAVTGYSRNETNTIQTFDAFKDDWSQIRKIDVLINTIGIMSSSITDLYNTHIGIASAIKDNYNTIGRPRIIHFSALGANTNASTHFLRSKGIGDVILLKYTKATILYPSIIAAKGSLLYEKINKLLQIAKIFHGIIPLPKAISKAEVQPITVEDIAEIVRELLLDENHPCQLQLLGPEKFTIRYLLDHCARIKGLQLKILEVSGIASHWFYERLIPLLAPSLLSREQFTLLLNGGVTHPHFPIYPISRLHSTKPFMNKVFQDPSIHK